MRFFNVDPDWGMARLPQEPGDPIYEAERLEYLASVAVSPQNRIKLLDEAYEWRKKAATIEGDNG